MPEDYMSLAPADQKDILQTAAIELGRHEAVLEKDIWVCWVLQVLFAIPGAHPMAFKGGTSLSKVYDIIDRFSEDVDITLDYRQFDDIDFKDHPQKFDPLAAGASKTQIAKFSDRLKGYVNRYSLEIVIPYLRNALAKLSTAKQHDITVDKTGEKIWLSFPSVVEATDDYLKTQILIELGGRNVIDPNEVHTITPYVAQITQGVSYPTGDVVVLSPERTFWEKATLIHVECGRPEIKQNAARLSRHWYDLVMLVQHPSGIEAIKNRMLFEDVIRHKKVFFNASYANYDACLAGDLKLLPADETISGLQIDYENMVNAGMMYQQPPDFSQIIESIKKIERDINLW
jgi:hypothetical protein